MSELGSPAPRSARYAAYLVLVALAYYVVAVVVLHLIEPELDPLARPISGYLRGRHPILARTTFFALAGALSALSLGLYQTRLRGRLVRVGLGLLGLAALGVVLAGLYPGPPLHLVGGLMAFPPTIAAVLVLSLRFRRAPGWEAWAARLFYLGLTVLALFPIGAVALEGLDLGGLGQRLFFAALFTWMAIVAWRIASSGSR